MADYSQDAAEALLAIKEDGAEFTFARTARTVDKITGEFTAGVPTTGKIWCVILPATASKLRAFDITVEGGQMKQYRYILGAADGAPFVPDETCTIEIAGENYNILGCSPLAPDGVTNIIFKMAAVKG